MNRNNHTYIVIHLSEHYTRTLNYRRISVQHHYIQSDLQEYMPLGHPSLNGDFQWCIHNFR